MATPSVQGRSVQAQIDSLAVNMEKGFMRIEELMKGFDERVRKIENEQAGCIPVIQERVETVAQSIGRHETEIALMKTTILELKQTQKLLSWVSGIVGSVLIIWLVNQILALIH